ncbi:glycosyl transferase [Fodinicola feengrottensis]|uniref:Glycosyl transferase n=1 Tax=Fodinicola feengrottensis TaxID=435914 RepID=A0ABN2G6I7_9ACTN
MTVDSPPATAEAEPVRLPAWRRWPIHATFVGVYVVLACYLFSGLWAGILSHGDGYLTTSSQDQYDWEWFFAVTARALTHGDNLLLSTLQGHPLGVNMMANTAMFGLSIPLAPVTLIFGPTITWALVLTLGMAASAGCWYWLMVRHLGISPVPAAIGAAFAGFAPPIVSHANAHPNLAVFFVLPLIIGQLLKMRTGEHRIRNGVILGLLVTYQLFLGEEALLMAALGIAVFAVAYAVVRPRDAWASARQLLPGIGISLAVFVPLVAYPLWFQFAGPQSYDSLQHGNYGNDLAALVTFPSRALAGDHPTALAYAYPTEENSFFGWPLVIVFLVVAVLVWRVLAARALVLTTLAITVLSLGATVAVHGHDTGIPMPWAILGHLPLFESMLDSRLTMICVPTIGILLAVATDLMLARTNRIKVVWSIALAAALVPIFPIPLLATTHAPTPAFFSQGIWRQYVPAGKKLPVIITVPTPEPTDMRAAHWQIEAGLGFALPEGYFVGPWDGTRQGSYGPAPRPTTELLRRVRDSGQVAIITDQDRLNAQQDFAYWGADLVVLPPYENDAALQKTIEQLLGPGRTAGGVVFWKVRVV